jgi:hypothetical protein
MDKITLDAISFHTVLLYSKSAANDEISKRSSSSSSSSSAEADSSNNSFSIIENRPSGSRERRGEISRD